MFEKFYCQAKNYVRKKIMFKKMHVEKSKLLLASRGSDK